MRLLIRHKITSLVDVRGSAKSIRNFQFNAENLERECIKVGILYRHCPELGNKKTLIEKLINTDEGVAAVKRLADDYENSDENVGLLHIMDDVLADLETPIVDFTIKIFDFTVPRGNHRG